MADWSDWVPLEEGAATAPLLPGVYMAREGARRTDRLCGHGRQASGGGKPKGLRKRLGVYASGKGIVSGLGEAVMDRVPADPEWLRDRLAEVERGKPMRAKEWGPDSRRPGRAPSSTDSLVRLSLRPWRHSTAGRGRGDGRHRRLDLGVHDRAHLRCTGRHPPSAAHVCGPTIPSTPSPREDWNRQTAPSATRTAVARNSPTLDVPAAARTLPCFHAYASKAAARSLEVKRKR